MNLRAVKAPVPVNMDKFDQAIQSYAPPAQRALEEPVKQVQTFGELPTKEIDEMVKAAEDQIAELKAQGQQVRDLYVRYTERLVEDLNRLQEGVKLSMEALKALKEQCQSLNIAQQQGPPPQ